MIAVDTNIIIRFLTHDDEGQYKKVLSIFNTDRGGYFRRGDIGD